MNKLLTILLLLLSIGLSAQDIGGDYYVSPTGDDSDPGTYAEPWATWSKAFSEAQAGDTVYFRGGVYYSATEHGHPRIDPFGYLYEATGHIGTKANPICLFNYPDETPILDCRDHIPYNDGSIIHGISLCQTAFIHLRGLTIRNLWQRGLVNLPVGISIIIAQSLKFENVTIHDISGRGIGGNVIVGYYDEANTPGDGYYDEDSTYFINCDIYNLCDSTSANPGNAADGIKVTLNGRTSHDVPHSYWHLQGCRFWNFSDDGTDIGGPGQVVHENCWSSSTNLFAPLGIEGNGFKSGGITWTDSDSLINKHWRIFKNCMAVDCEGEGFYDLDYISYFRTNGLFVNNIAYDNLVGFTAKTSYSFRPRTTKYFNNIAYSNNKFENNTYVEVEIGSGTAWEYTEHHNTWDNNNPSPASWPYFVMTDTVTITNDDFQSVDVSQLFEARKSDGSLPDITAFRLATGSDLIGAGTNVGMSATPDIGIDWSYLDSLNPPVRRKAAVVNGKFAKSIRGNLLIFNQ